MADQVVITKSKLDNLARVVSTKSGAALELTIDQMITAINSIDISGSGSSTINNQNKSVTPSESQQLITADSGYTGLGTVTVNAISSSYVGSSISRRSSTDLTVSGATVTAPSGYYSTAASKTIASGSVIVVDDYWFETIDGVYTCQWEVGASANASGYIQQGNTLDNKNYSWTAIPSGTVITPTESLQTIGGENYMMEGAVTVNAIPSNYIGSGITQRSSTDLTVSGATVTAPSGYYSTAASKSVASGSASAPSSISGTSASVTTGTNTLTLTKTVSVTPTVTAGYISSGTAGNSSVSLTASVTTKAAATYHPSTTAQTISASQYLTGAQTIAAVTTTNLSASNIVSGVTIKVGDSSDDDCVASVTGNVVLQNYYTGSSAPSSSTGSNGDLYLQS